MYVPHTVRFKTFEFCHAVHLCFLFQQSTFHFSKQHLGPPSDVTTTNPAAHRGQGNQWKYRFKKVSSLTIWRKIIPTWIMIDFTDYSFTEISSSVIEQSMTHFRNKRYMLRGWRWAVASFAALFLSWHAYFVLTGGINVVLCIWIASTFMAYHC
jgi:hypothetical protein